MDDETTSKPIIPMTLVYHEKGDFDKMEKDKYYAVQIFYKEASVTYVAKPFSFREVHGVAVIDLKGQLLLGSTDEHLRATVEYLVAQGHRRVALNMTDVSYCDSAGTGELVRSHFALVRSNGRLKFFGLCQKVKDLLRITGLAKGLDIYETETEAVASFTDKYLITTKPPTIEEVAQAIGATPEMVADVKKTVKEMFGEQTTNNEEK